MTNQLIEKLQQELPDYKSYQIENVITMLNEGNTVPFIARYRKERTGSLDEVAIQSIQEAYEYQEHLEERKETILKAIDDQGKLTDSLRKEILEADQLQALEDLYSPYKKKRRTKATKAKEQGLEPLADWLKTNPLSGSIEEEADKYINDQVNSGEEALAGAHEILCEWISEVAKYRSHSRQYVWEKGYLASKKRAQAEDEKETYAIYYDFAAPLSELKSYQVLAINRAEKEKVVSVSLDIEAEPLIQAFSADLIVKDSIASPLLEKAIEDSLARFLLPQAFRAIRTQVTETAEDHAIDNFSENLKNLLMQQPLKGQVVLGWDPAYRTGCKLAVLDETGQVLDKTVVYPTPPHNKKEAAAKAVTDLIEKYQIGIIAIGNGTASRESEEFVAQMIQDNQLSCRYTIVSESGASVYSASEIARKEFPDYQVEERSAVSIGRRLQDPLAELVKIDPKAIGVGQYQHDVNQTKLNDQLDFTVELVVNRVGVELNTASASLLSHVAGLTKTVAKNIVTYRNENGKFESRKDLHDVPRLGPKAFEQAAGFLRITDGKNILDNTGIHPESYSVTEAILAADDIDPNAIREDDIHLKIKNWNINRLCKKYDIGRETLKDIQKALLVPGRDPRSQVAGPVLRQDVVQLEDLKPGMALQGTVRNVVDFGAFVDIGVKQDGLVHISKMSHRFVKDPQAVVSVGDIVDVWVDSVDVQKGRIGLTMLKPQ
ncbi:Tex family protein [Aerococcus urinae]|uniref:RNA-binding transcriptional accessory protein n=2 Tax=Aerococcus urinae TaxID=1376 RepID=A0A109RFV8_9LACT|nr:Tex family protein [Aerococcus urinae]AMB95905.1 RNA-binding transcriptional accessory protein [Aerococcus urinae]MCY3032491.1 RNA-binding transcriptional accessory protein [Aerococcus urinae]MCY3044537.1 RNA-binding transcriptional accessory protein [Aerococcus urinae]MCY3047992.1 RNA-binding transcriptional accessory protein [Aerococcus urinae]MCY3050640.1 RNA-binding transcriptional accessory protein [Aerococcus urinae]